MTPVTKKIPNDGIVGDLLDDIVGDLLDDIVLDDTQATKRMPNEAANKVCYAGEKVSSRYSLT
jgi:hypothetical protein